MKEFAPSTNNFFPFLPPTIKKTKSKIPPTESHWARVGKNFLQLVLHTLIKMFTNLQNSILMFGLVCISRKKFHDPRSHPVLSILTGRTPCRPLGRPGCRCCTGAPYPAPNTQKFICTRARNVKVVFLILI